jgi:hypothetical protein
MIPLPIRILAILASGGYLLAVLVTLRNSQLNVKQSLLWLSSGFLFLVISIFPEPLMHVAERLGFIAPSNAAFVTWLLVLTILLFYQSLTTSRQAAQLRTLCQEISMLKASQRGADLGSHLAGDSR